MSISNSVSFPIGREIWGSFPIGQEIWGSSPIGQETIAVHSGGALSLARNILCPVGQSSPIGREYFFVSLEV